MVLRQYQYYAIEKLIDKVKNTNKNGYIWHTTGSGKTPDLKQVDSYAYARSS